MRPPILTDRQLQILEYVAVGATRKEIATELKISPETVKDHVKAIFEKFGVQSLRDGFSEISDFLKLYGEKNGIPSHQYFTDVLYQVYIAPNYQGATWFRRTRGYVVVGRVSKFSTRLIENRTVSDVMINGKKPKITSKRSANLNYSIDLVPPLCAGDKFTRTFQARMNCDDGSKYTETINTIATPTEHLVIELFFPDPFHSFSGYLTRNIETLNIQTCDHITIDVGLETARVSIDNPQIADRYSVQWNPTM